MSKTWNDFMIKINELFPSTTSDYASIINTSKQIEPTDESLDISILKPLLLLNFTAKNTLIGLSLHILSKCDSRKSTDRIYFLYNKNTENGLTLDYDEIIFLSHGLSRMFELDKMDIGKSDSPCIGDNNGTFICYDFVHGEQKDCTEEKGKPKFRFMKIFSGKIATPQWIISKIGTKQALILGVTNRKAIKLFYKSLGTILDWDLHVLPKTVYKKDEIIIL